MPTTDQLSNGGLGLRVLVVEDHVDSATAVARLLKMEGYRPQVARDCKSAMSLAEREGFDLVISDIGLPDCSGHELMRLLSQMAPIKGIALSGHVSSADERASRDAGFSAHLAKPLDFTKLREAIVRVVGE